MLTTSKYSLYKSKLALCRIHLGARKRVFYHLNKQKQVMYSFRIPISVRQIKLQPFCEFKNANFSMNLTENFHKKRAAREKNQEMENERV